MFHILQALIMLRVKGFIALKKVLQIPGIEAPSDAAGRASVCQPAGKLPFFGRVLSLLRLMTSVRGLADKFRDSSEW